MFSPRKTGGLSTAAAPNEPVFRGIPLAASSFLKQVVGVVVSSFRGVSLGRVKIGLPERGEEAEDDAGWLRCCGPDLHFAPSPCRRRRRRGPSGHLRVRRAGRAR